jgi:hypothetical protein
MFEKIGKINIILIISIIIIITILYLLKTENKNNAITTKSVQHAELLTNTYKNTLTLYHADWCHFCSDFLPIWGELVAIINKNSNKYQLELVDVNCTDTKTSAVNCPNVPGFPTMRLAQGDKTENYTGPRTLDDVIKYLENKLNISIDRT